MPLTIGAKRVVVRRGQEVRKELTGSDQKDPIPVLLTTGPPTDLTGTERWHLEAWAEVRKRLSFLRNDLVVDAFTLFMDQVEDDRTVCLYEDDSEVAAGLIAALRQQYPERFLRESERSLDRELEVQRDANPKTWALFAPVIQEPRYEDPTFPPLFRRLDALARLLHTCLENLKIKLKPKGPKKEKETKEKEKEEFFKPVCVAVTYSGGRFLVAMNEPLEDLKGAALCKAIAQELYGMRMFGVSTPTELRERLRTAVDGQLLLDDKDLKGVQEDNLATDANKVLTWLKKDLALATADEFAARLMFIPHLGFHAEMSLLAWLLTEPHSPLSLSVEEGALLKHLRCTEFWNEPLAASQSRGDLKGPVADPSRFANHFSIGISYLCCPHCYYTFHKYNEMCAARSRELRPMAVRGYHTADKGGWSFVFDKTVPQHLKGRDPTELLALAKRMYPLAEATFADNQRREQLKLKKKPAPGKDEKKQQSSSPPKQVEFKIQKTQGRGGQFVSRINKRQDRSPSPRRPVPRVCAVCGKETTLHCGRCFTVFYCSKDCQRTDWKTHKPVCAAQYTAPTRGRCPMCGQAANVPCPHCEAVDYCGAQCLQRAWKDHQHVCTGL